MIYFDTGSKILLAGLNASGTTSVIEPASSRDHTERMLKAFGADINIRGELGRNIVIKSGNNKIVHLSESLVF